MIIEWAHTNKTKLYTNSFLQPMRMLKSMNRTNQMILLHFFSSLSITIACIWLFLHLSQLQISVCGVRELAVVFIFSPNLFIHRCVSVFFFEIVNATASSNLRLFFGHRFKAYTHELSVIDFIIVVFCMLSLCVVVFRLKSLHLVISGQCIHFSVIYFNLFVLREKKKTICSRIDAWFNSNLNRWLISMIFFLFRMSFIIYSLNSHENEKNDTFLSLSHIQILINYYAVCSQNLCRTPSCASVREKKAHIKMAQTMHRAQLMPIVINIMRFVMPHKRLYVCNETCKLFPLDFQADWPIGVNVNHNTRLIFIDVFVRGRGIQSRQTEIKKEWCTNEVQRM